MNREPKPNGNEHDEFLLRAIRERLQNLFPSREQIPTPMNVHQTDQMKARIGELEAELAQRAEHTHGNPDVAPADSASDSMTPPRGRRVRLAGKILLPALLIFALSLGGFLLSSYLTTRADNQARQEENSRQVEEIFNSEIRRLGDFALGLAIDAANNPDIQAAFAARDRAELTRLTLDGYRALDAQFNVPQYQYHLPPAISFLRLHSPNKYGDDLSSLRATVLQVNQTLQPVVGLEVGRGGLGLRGIEPVYYQGQHIGSVEYGLNVDQNLVADLKQAYGYDWRIILTREALTLATLEDISALKEGPTPDLLVLASTLDTPVFANTESYQKALSGGRTLSTVKSGTGASYSATTLPLRDYSGKVIGVVDIFIDQTAAVQAQNGRL
jgi:methyl-accepting chemotaxis protein